MKKLLLFLLCVCFIISIYQCSSTPEEGGEPLEPVEEPTPVPVKDDDEFDTSGIAGSIEVLGDGLSPNGDGLKDKIAFKITPEQKDKITAWKLEMKHGSTGKVNKVFSGTNAPLDSMSWDGKENGEIVMEGKYKAILTLEYEGSGKPVSVETDTFMLDVTPPELTLKARPAPFSPDGDGVNDTVTISFTVNDASPVSKWELKVYDEGNDLFHTFTGAGDTRKNIVWDGINEAGHVVEIASDYKAVLLVTDNCINSSKVEAIIPVDILIEITPDNRNKIRIGHIIFKAYTSDFKEITKDILSSNMVSFKQLSRLMKKYPEYTILIEGHAMMPKDKLKDKREFEKYNTEVLVPLSKDRAENVKKALINLGIEDDRIFTQGIGASAPLVDHDDFKNRWMNRRVEFYLVRD